MSINIIVRYGAAAASTEQEQDHNTGGTADYRPS
jgi:hypothetical protein